jgi:hypothetical protein
MSRRPRSFVMEHQDAAIRKLLDKMRLMEVRLSERISGHCDGVERRQNERCEEPCNETSIFDEGPIFDEELCADVTSIFDEGPIFDEEPCFHRRFLDSDPDSPCDWVDLSSIVRATAPSSRDLLPPPGIRAMTSGDVASEHPQEVVGVDIRADAPQDLLPLRLQLSVDFTNPMGFLNKTAVVPSGPVPTGSLYTVTRVEATKQILKLVPLDALKRDRPDHAPDAYTVPSMLGACAATDALSLRLYAHALLFRELGGTSHASAVTRDVLTNISLVGTRRTEILARKVRDIRLLHVSSPSPDSELDLPIGKHVPDCASVDKSVPDCASVDRKSCLRAYTPTSMEDEVGHFGLDAKEYILDEHSKFLNDGLMNQLLDPLPLDPYIEAALSPVSSIVQLVVSAEEEVITNSPNRCLMI